MGFTLIDFHLNTFNSSQANFSFAPNFTQGPNPNFRRPNTGVGSLRFLLGTGGGNASPSTRWRRSAKNSWAGISTNLNGKVTRNVSRESRMRYDFQLAPTDRF